MRCIDNRFGGRIHRLRSLGRRDLCEKQGERGTDHEKHLREGLYHAEVCENIACEAVSG